MTKPIGYYVAMDIPELAEIEEIYGENLERMTRKQKIHLSSVVAKTLADSTPVTNQRFKERCIAIADGITKQEDAIALLKKLAASL